MDFSVPTVWWLAAGTLVAVELATGTIYLLMLALGAGAAALVAHLQGPAATQWVAAALVGGGATVFWHLKRASTPHTDTAHNPDVNIDIGQPVHVADWQADGTARVPYRGSSWPARHAGTGAPQPGLHRIVAVQGNELQLGPQSGQAHG